MEVGNKMMDQLLTAGAAQTGTAVQTAKGQKAEGSQEGKDFDSMVRQKYQESGKGEETGESEAAAQETGPRAEQGQSSEEEQPNSAQQLLAAAMVLQQPVVPAEEPVRAEETAIQAVPAAAEGAVLSPELQAAQLRQPQQQETSDNTQTRTGQPQAAAVPEQQPQQMEVQVAASQPSEEPVPQETAVVQEVVTDTETRAERTVRTPEDAGRTEEAPKEAPVLRTPAETAPEAPKTPAAETVPEGTVELEAPKGPETLAQTMQNVLDRGGSECVILLEPKELGMIQVTFTREKDGALRILIETSNPRTQTLLEKHMTNLQNTLAENLREDVDVRVEQRHTDKLFQDLWEGHQQRQQDREQRREHEKKEVDDFIQRLRLGLTGLEDEDE